MGMSDHIELLEVEEYIHKSEVMIGYLWEGGLLPFIEGMIKHEENISMQCFNSWNDIRVTINGMSFEITEDLITWVSGFPMGGKNWCK